MPKTYEQRLDRQDRFLAQGEGNLLILGGYFEGFPRHENNLEIEGQSSCLSEEFLQAHAYDLGIQHYRNTLHWLHGQLALDDDTIPAVMAHWGSGVGVTLFADGDVIFEEMTSYVTDTAIKSWDDVDKLAFDPDNRWAQYTLDYWCGVASEYAEGVALCPFGFKSPLDLANGLRGNQVFLDMYDHPEEFERLLAVCTDMIVDATNFLRREIPILRTAPSGVWGQVIREPTMMFVNGDPVDLISDEMGERFNRPYVERLCREAGPVFFHHHTLGVERVTSVARIEGIIVQNFIYDPKCPRVLDIIDEEWIEASHRCPIEICQDLGEANDLDAVLEKLARGRFIVHATRETADDCNRMIAKIRKYQA
jgi:hypothetical protein